MSNYHFLKEIRASLHNVSAEIIFFWWNFREYCYMNFLSPFSNWELYANDWRFLRNLWFFLPKVIAIVCQTGRWIFYKCLSGVEVIKQKIESEKWYRRQPLIYVSFGKRILSFIFLRGKFDRKKLDFSISPQTPMF